MGRKFSTFRVFLEFFRIVGQPGCPSRARKLALNLENYLPKLANQSNWAMAVDKSLFTKISREIGVIARLLLPWTMLQPLSHARAPLELELQFLSQL